MSTKIGILGCQSKHAEFFGALFNIDGAFPGFSAPFIYGDDAPSRLTYVCETAQIPEICQSAHELIARSDAVLITYRMAERHFDPAMACIQKGKPVFVDKPFTLDPKRAQTLADACLEKHVPLIGGSTLCYDPQISAVEKETNLSTHGTIAYQAQTDSPFGGYRFYGSHLTDLCATIFSTRAVSTRAFRINDSVNVLVRYPNRIVILHSSPRFEKPEICFSDGKSLKSIALDDVNCYQLGMDTFVRAIQRGQANVLKLEQLIFSVNLLYAILKSLETGEEIDLIG